MKIDDIIKSMESKLDETNKGLIADDFANLITYSYDTDKTISDKDEMINKLKSDKEKLLISNGNLLQKISAEKDDVLNPSEPKKEEVKQDFNFATLFDSKGNFKK